MSRKAPNLAVKQTVEKLTDRCKATRKQAGEHSVESCRECPLSARLIGRLGSIATVQLMDGNDCLPANYRQLMVQRSDQDATSKLTKNDGSTAVTVIMISEHGEHVADQSEPEQ